MSLGAKRQKSNRGRYRFQQRIKSRHRLGSFVRVQRAAGGLDRLGHLQCAFLVCRAGGVGESRVGVGVGGGEGVGRGRQWAHRVNGFLQAEGSFPSPAAGATWHRPRAQKFCQRRMRARMHVRMRTPDPKLLTPSHHLAKFGIVDVAVPVLVDILQNLVNLRLGCQDVAILRGCGRASGVRLMRRGRVAQTLFRPRPPSLLPFPPLPPSLSPLPPRVEQGGMALHSTHRTEHDDSRPADLGQGLHQLLPGDGA